MKTLKIILLVCITNMCFAQIYFEGKNGTLKFGLKVEKSPAKLSFYVPEQQTFDMPFSNVKTLKDSIFGEFSLSKVKIKGQLAAQDSVFSGEWIQNGKATKLNLKKVEKLSFSHNRPQTPHAPFPYQVEDVKFSNAKKDISFGGTLTFPQDKNKKFSAVILISGSGQQDRDETLAEHKPFWVIADHLTRNGFAVLRIDDRGIGETTGDVGTSDDYANDVLAAIDFLKKRRDINPQKIGLMGHSEGGMIAPMVASKSKEVAFIVSLAGLGVKGKDLLLRQNDDVLKLNYMNEKGRQSYRELNETVFSLIESLPLTGNISDTLSKTFNNWVKNQPTEKLASMGMNIPAVQNNYRRQLPTMNSLWYRFFVKYDPYPALAKLKIPILALNGEKDVQVAAQENLDVFTKAAQTANNTRLTTKSYPDLNHLFQHANSGSILEYAIIEETISPEVLADITTWLKAL